MKLFRPEAFLGTTFYIIGFAVGEAAESQHIHTVGIILISALIGFISGTIGIYIWETR